MRRSLIPRLSASTWMAITAASFIVLVIVCGLFAPLLAPHSPLDSSLSATLQPPIGFGGTWSHALGTDELGRDILSRLLYGARVSMIIGLGAVGLSTVVGVAVGLVSAYSGGAVDAILMRLVEVQFAFPTIILALILAAVIGPGVTTVFISVIAVYWAYFARLTRGEALKVKTSDFVSLARVAGASRYRIVTRHLFPNITNGVIVLFSLQVASGITFEAALSFLGLGIQPPNPSWGSMLGAGRGYVTIAWWLSVIPGAVIALTILSLNMLGDWVRDKLDPKRQRLA